MAAFARRGDLLSTRRRRLAKRALLLLWRSSGEILDHGCKSLRSDFHRTGERIIDFHNDQQPGKDQDRQSACHQLLSAQVVGTEKEGEPDGQKDAAEKHHPENWGLDAVGHDTAFPRSLTDAIDLL